MAFHEVQFPTNISQGSRGGPGFNTLMHRLDSGHVIKTSRWSQALHRYDASYGIRDYDTDLKTVLDFYHARQGSAHGFRWKDWMDFSTDSTGRGTADWDDQNLGVFGTATDTIQLRKAYTDAGNTAYRNITKPVSGTVKVGWDHDGDSTPTEQSSGWTVDTTTGVITITDSSADGKTIYAGCQFDVPVQFTEEADELLQFQLTDYATGDVPRIPLEEIADPTVVADDFNYGGAKLHAADASISLADGRVHWSEQSSGDINLTMPQPTNYYALGGPYFYFLHDGTAGNLVIKNYAGVTQVTLAAGEGAVALLVISSGTRKFRIWGT